MRGCSVSGDLRAGLQRCASFYIDFMASRPFWCLTHQEAGFYGIENLSQGVASYVKSGEASFQGI